MANKKGKNYKVASILARAIVVFGTKELAEVWMARPTRGLQWKKPIDVLNTDAGIKAVETLLHQIEHGIYV